MTPGRSIDDFYPEIAAEGGLVPALNAALRSRGRPTGESLSPSAVAGDSPLLVETGRGSLMVYLALKKRDFFLRVDEAGFAWVCGSTADIGILAEAIADWRQGMPLDDFARKFPFIELGEMARALERGDIVAAQWEWALAHNYYVAEHSLLAALHAAEGLSELMPAVSHHSVRLSFDWRRVDERYLVIDPPRDHRYRISVQFGSRIEYEVESLESVVALVRDLVAAEK